MLKKFIPKKIKRIVRESHQNYVFNKSVKEFSQLKADSLLSEKVLPNLIYGWGNEGMSAGFEYLSAIVEQARKSKEPILECGSGLSTVLLGIIAEKNGNQVWTLEHHPEWAERVRVCLKNFGINSVEMCVAPLRVYKEFSWYDAPLAKMPDNFSLIICDGPPGDVRGGRYGMLPVMRPFLKSKCVILADDASREKDKEVVERWAQELNTDFEISGLEKPFATLIVP